MKYKKYDFAPGKNQWLKVNRNISIEEVIAAMEEGNILDIVHHSNAGKYSNQNIYVLNISSYIYLVPLIKQSESNIFLKTIFRSHKKTDLHNNCDSILLSLQIFRFICEKWS